MNRLQRSEPILRKALIIGIAAAISLWPVGCVKGATGQDSAPVKASTAATAVAIPVSDVASRATEASNLLHQQLTQLAPSRAVETIRKQLPKVSGHIDLLLEGTGEILRDQPPLATLQTQRQIWQGLQLQVAGWLKVLTERAVQLREALDRLAEVQQTWTATSAQAKESNAPATILQQIAAVLTAVETAQSTLQAQRDDLLDLQSQAAAAADKCGNALAQIAQAQTQAVSGILARDRPPIWNGELWSRARAPLPGRIRQIVADCREDLEQYLVNPANGLPFHAGLAVTFMLLLTAAQRLVRRWQAAGEYLASSSTAFDHPVAAGLLSIALVATGPSSPAPPTVQTAFGLLALVPIIRLTRTAVDPRLMHGLYGLGILFALDSIRGILDGVPLVGQILLILETLAGGVMLGWSLTYGNLRGAAGGPTRSGHARILRFGGILVLITLAGGLAAAVMGYTPLARLLASETVVGGVLALAAYGFVLMLSGVVAFALRIWPLRLLQLVRHHRPVLEHHAYRLLLVMAVFGWGARLLQRLGLLGPALSSVKAILAINLERGTISISMGDVLTFLLTVWLAYLLSSFIRFLLGEDVYPRMQLAPGLSYAISNLLHYVILALGVVVGMGLMGIDLSQLTVLAGAFGVGIGFGLQSVINNFVCGLILLFERPIHVGDLVEIGDLLGEVHRIGIRASTVRTRQGADIIVPNAQLVTEKVTNWTLGDKLRRLQLTVGVNYGVDPEAVLELLVKVARANPQVLPTPEPYALFTSHGESSINFELRAWTDESLQWHRVLSDLNVAVYDAVLAAGMSFPFPQREVRLLHDADLGTARKLPAAKAQTT